MSTAVAIGVFDGVHIGHQALLAETAKSARELRITPAVLTFHPHPACVVAPERAPKMLYSLEERCRILGAYGIEKVEVLPFTSELSHLSPEAFAQGLLRGRMDAQAVIVGGNFRFGFRQAGNIVTLRDLGQQLHFLVRSVEPVSFRQHSVSSSLIRRQIEDGDVALAARMLGRPYALSGEVVRGHGIGSKQTVPTLNLATDAQVLPEHGVYITRTTDLADGRVWDSITNVGVRPTFSGEGELTIETFLLSKLEGETPSQIQVELLRHVREERKFASPDELKAQIFRDVARANTFHRRAQKWISSLATQPRQ